MKRILLIIASPVLVPTAILVLVLLAVYLLISDALDMVFGIGEPTIDE